MCSRHSSLPCADNFTVYKEWKNRECNATFTNCAYPSLRIIGHPGALTVDGKVRIIVTAAYLLFICTCSCSQWVEHDSQAEWVLENVPGRDQRFQRMYIMCEDGRKMYFYVKYDGNYSFRLGCGDGDDKIVDENDIFFIQPRED